MPVSFNVATCRPPCQSCCIRTPEQLLAEACAPQYRSAGDIRGSSFTPPGGRAKSSLNRRLSKLNPFTNSKAPPPSDPPSITDIIPTPNGLVHTVISAYNKHHNLILRPDDVWIAILTQFNFYVNANAELFRANFVRQKELKIVGLMGTVIDRTVGAIVMMSTLKAYFEYVFESIECGIPRVTLDGTKADWENIQQRLEKLKEYGLETIAWYHHYVPASPKLGNLAESSPSLATIDQPDRSLVHLLVPVISRFVKAFDSPDAAPNLDFWQRVAHFEPGGSGPSHYSGWISAFCVFNEEGSWIGQRLHPADTSMDPESMTAKDFWSNYLKPSYIDPPKFVLDETPFHMVECRNIPASYVEVPVTLASQDGSQPEPCTMIAGVIGTLVTSSEDSENKEKDTVQPVTGWWVFSNKKVRQSHTSHVIVASDHP
ncbi:hypothetical protein DFH09DRAFT_1311646 [Mycena vulgaris]|nr:hypothetical protein DFH09DRAFT_1311646 [Mycena vulgaris]